jgi:hypothetical protein
MEQHGRRADMSGNGADGRDDVVVRRAERGWVVGGENVSDLTSAMVLADLFAADQADGDGDGSALPPTVSENDASARPAPLAPPVPAGPRTLRRVPEPEAERL